MPEVSVVESVNVHVIVPVFNEARCLEQSVRALLVEFAEFGAFRIYLVDDGSTDVSLSLMKRLEKQYPTAVRVLLNQYGKGKGGAVRTALDQVSGGLVGVHDADLEYEPKDLAAMFRSVMREGRQLALGSRLLGNNRFLPFQRLQNRLLTRFANAFFPEGFTDIAACYKVFDASLLDGHRFRFSGFGFDYELVVLLLKRASGFMEMPVRFTPRDIRSGKKLKSRHGIAAIFAFLITYMSVWRYPEANAQQVRSGRA